MLRFFRSFQDLRYEKPRKLEMICAVLKLLQKNKLESLPRTLDRGTCMQMCTFRSQSMLFPAHLAHRSTMLMVTSFGVSKWLSLQRYPNYFKFLCHFLFLLPRLIFQMTWHETSGQHSSGCWRLCQVPTTGPFFFRQIWCFLWKYAELRFSCQSIFSGIMLQF